MYENFLGTQETVRIREVSVPMERFHCLLLEKKAAHKIHMKPHPGLREHIFHILTSEDIDDFHD